MATLVFNQNDPPFAALATLKYIDLHHPDEAKALGVTLVSSGIAEKGKSGSLNLSGLPTRSGNATLSVKEEKITGSLAIARYFARAVTSAELYSLSPITSSQVDEYLQLADKLAESDFKTLSKAAHDLDSHLRFRTFLVSHRFTIADFALWAVIKHNPVAAKAFKSEGNQHLTRYLNFVDAQPFVLKANQTIKDLDVKEVKKEQASYDIDLPGAAKGNVVTRFPPEPSGYLHIGHAKAALLNEYFARHYEGKLIVRFDDTNPSKEKMEFEDSIIEDLKLLGITADCVTHTSDHFEVLLSYAERMLREGSAYADDTDQETMRDQRMKGIPSKRRDQSVEENFRMWEQMKEATEFGQKCCLRAKMSVDDNNKALRDPVIYRVNLTPHHCTGSKYKVYPTYDFACPIVDSIEGVTHALRTNEYHDRNPQYYWFIEKLGLRKPHIWDYSRMNFAYTLLSKRKLQWFVDRKIVESWADPRFPTVRGIRRRGMTIEALKEYILMQGPSKNVLLLDWDKFWAVNKKVIDPVAPRFVALNRANLYEVRLSKAPEVPETKLIPRHKKNPAIGNKETTFAPVVYLDGEDAQSLEENEEVTLMDWGNIIIRKIFKNIPSSDGVVVGYIEADLHLEGDFKKTKKKLTWLPDQKAAPLIPVALHDYDYLINKRKLEEDDNFEDFLTKVTEFKTSAWADKNVATLTHGSIIQFERRGYFILDSGAGTLESPLNFILIPDGSQKSTASKSDDPASMGSGNKKKEAKEEKKKDAKEVKEEKKKDGKEPKTKEGKESKTTKEVKKDGKSDAAQDVPRSSNNVDISAIKMYRIDPLITPLGADQIQLPTCMYRIAPLDEI